MSDEKIAKRYYEAKRRAEARYRRVHDYGGDGDIEMLIDHADKALEMAARTVEEALHPKVRLRADAWPGLRMYLAASIRALRSDGGGR